MPSPHLRVSGCWCHTLRGRGSREVRLSLALEVESDQLKFKLAPPLAQLLGKATGSRAGVLRSLFTYIRKEGLQVWPLGTLLSLSALLLVGECRLLVITPASA